MTDVSKDSLTVVTGALTDKSLAPQRPFTAYQFERVGFFSLDPDSTDVLRVFNRTVGLKEDKGKN